MADKKVYIVRGSEDGNLGVYSNMKRAYERAVRYISEKDANECELNRALGLINYQKCCKHLGTYNTVEWSDKHFSSVSITMFYLND